MSSPMTFYEGIILANIQRDALLLRIETLAVFRDFDKGFEGIEYSDRDFEAVDLRRDFLTAQLRVEAAQFSDNADAIARLEQLGNTLAEYDILLALVRADPTFDGLAAIAKSEEILIRLELQVKALYDYQEVRFFQATAASLGAQKSAQSLLLIACIIMVSLCLVLAASLRPSVRTGFKRAYRALETEVKKRRRAETGLRLQEEALRESEEQFRDLYENAPLAYFSVTMDGNINMVNRSSEQLLGYARNSLIGRSVIDLYADTPSGKEKAKDLNRRIQEGEEIYNEEMEMSRMDGKSVWVSLTVRIISNVQGRSIERQAIVADITERKQPDDKINASLDEKEVLLKEINHRVKNNLQIISSLLNLQSRDIQDEQALRSFQVSQDRIRTMAMMHEKLYQSDDLARIDFGEYIKSLATDLGSSYGLGLRDIDLKIDVENILLGVDTAIPCGVIVNELVANSLKHAFTGDRSGEIAISFWEVDGQYTMVFKDDGVGLPEDLDISHPSSLGLTIVNALTSQLGGTIGLGCNGGSEIIITFPAK